MLLGTDLQPYGTKYHKHFVFGNLFLLDKFIRIFQNPQIENNQNFFFETRTQTRFFLMETKVFVAISYPGWTSWSNRFEAFIYFWSRSSLLLSFSSKMTALALARGRALIAARQFTTSATRSEIHPGYLKFKERQKAFQIDNGLKVSFSKSFRSQKMTVSY